MNGMTSVLPADFILNIAKTDYMQFRFMIGRGTANAIFIVKQMQEAYVKKKQNLFFYS